MRDREGVVVAIDTVSNVEEGQAAPRAPRIRLIPASAPYGQSGADKGAESERRSRGRATTRRRWAALGGGREETKGLLGMWLQHAR